MKSLKEIARAVTILLIAPGMLFLCSTMPVNKKKDIYIPQEFSDIDWQSDTSKYSYHRMSETDNIVVFWEKGFEDDLSKAPDLDGNPMQVDIDNLTEKLERFYLCFSDTLGFVNKGSLSEKYKMMCMIQYSLDGTAYGGSYDNTIGALWVTPNRLQDPKQNVLAHELGHSFQSQIIADGEGEAWCGAPFFEMTSQWMLWYVNPEWVTDENYHWQTFKENTHKSFLHPENMYNSPYVLESWSEKHGLRFIAELFREGKCDENPIMTYARITESSWDHFADEMFENYQQLINFDYQHSFQYTRQWANSFSPFSEKMDKLSNKEYRVKSQFAPGDYGFNVIKLSVPQKGEKVEIIFNGLTDETDSDSNAGWRYGFVGIDADGKSIKGEINRNNKGEASFSVNDDLSHLWFVVMGAPVAYARGSNSQWPYIINIHGSAVL